MLDSFPRFDASPANWKGSDLAKTPDRWMHDLSAAELGDLEAVIAAAGDRTDDLTNVTAERPALAAPGAEAEGDQSERTGRRWADAHPRISD